MMRLRLLLHLVFAAALVAQGCVRTGKTAAAPPPVVLGAIYDLTGTQAVLDGPSARGAHLAADEVNRAGGLLGRPVRLVVEDGESTPEVAAKKAASLLEKFPSVSALLGLSDTDMVRAVAPVAAGKHRLFLTSGATSPRLTAQVPGYLFLACFGDNVQAAAAAEWAHRERGARTAAVLFNGSMEYTRLLHGYFEERFAQLGGRILSTEGYEPEHLSGVAAQTVEADVVFLAAGPDDALKAVLLLRRAGYRGPIIGGDGFDSDGWLAHPEVRDVYFTTHAYLGEDNPDPRVLAFRKAYLEAFPGQPPDAFAALGYDAARLLFAAVVRAGTPEPEKVRAALADIRHFEGVTGTLSYPAGSGVPRKSVTILAFEDGVRRFIRRLLPEQVPAP